MSGPQNRAPATPQERVDAAIARIDEQLNGLVAYPFSWGNPEAIEGIAVALLTVRAALAGDTLDGFMAPAYRGILRRRFGERNVSLAGCLKSEATEEIADMLARFIDSERKRVGVPSKAKRPKRRRFWKKGGTR